MKQWLLGFIFKWHALLFARRGFYWLNYVLYNLGLRGLGVLNYSSSAVSGEADFVKRHLASARGGVVLDVGSNEGDYVELVRKYNTNVKAYCFEPHPLTFSRLQEKCRRLNVDAFNVGVGREPGQLNLYDYAANDGSSHASMHREVFDHIHHAELVSHQVPIICLDEFVIEKQIESVKLLKIDVEGFEFNVLKGFAQYIGENKVEMIHFEFNEMNFASRVFFKDFWDFLPNYDFYRMIPGGLLPIKQYSPILCEIFAYQNIVCILKNGVSNTNAVEGQ
jgi:FkbM family methyltransferase